MLNRFKIKSFLTSLLVSACMLAGLTVCASQPVFAVDAPAQPLFKAPTNSGLIWIPFFITSADFNGDGNADLAGVAFSYSNVLIQLADGKGGFGAPQEIHVSPYPWHVAAGDFNGDGKADLVTANQNSHNVSILLGDGAGGFGAPTNFPTGNYPLFVAVGDFNGDAKSDLVLKLNDNANISIMLGDGAGNFGAPSNFVIGSGINKVTVGDFNRDGKSDLALLHAGPNPGFAPGSVSLLLNNGNGGFTPSAMNYSVNEGTPTSVVVADFNKDGKSDLVVGCDYCNKVAVFNGNGTGGFAPARNFVAGRTPPVNVASGDFNGDGKADIAALDDFSDGVSVILGNGRGSFGKHFTMAAGFDPRGLAVGDFNGDGKSDVAVTSNTSRALWVYLGNQAGNFNSLRVSAGAHPAALALRDLNKDGNLDLVVANVGSNNISILLGNGAGGFSRLATYNVGEGPSWLAFGDFNKDGKSDLAVTNTASHTVSILLGDGTGRFGAPHSFDAGIWPNSIAAGDFNGDGNADLAVSHPDLNSSVVMIFLGDGLGGFGAPREVNTIGSGATSITATDLNNDGKSDLAVTNSGSNKLAILLNKGDGSFRSSVIGVNFSPQQVIAGDFNGDGKADLATANSYNPGGVAVLLGAGTGSFRPIKNYVGRYGDHYSITADDFNGDGLPDLATANNFSHDVSILNGTGGGNFSFSKINFGAGNNPEFIVSGDVNNDGKPDLVVANAGSSPLFEAGTGSISILLNACDPAATSVPSLSISDVQVQEGDAGTVNAVFTVSLSAASAQQVKVNFATADGSATVAKDYLARSGLLTFSPGVTTRTISVPVKGDVLNEASETLRLYLTNAVNATACDAIGVATIKDNDPLPSLAINDVSVTEGNNGATSATFTVRLSSPSGQIVTVNFATANTTAAAARDYVAASGRLIFDPGQTSKSITVQIINDTSDETDETFKVRLTTPTNATVADSLGVGTILDDDLP